ncbi:MAG: hypothetical protein U0X76_01555 [Bacteroidia bacterium]
MKTKELNIMLKSKALRVFLMIIPVMMLNSCSLFEPASPEAGFLKIDSIQLSSDPATQGGSSYKITDAWVFVDQQYIGTFPLPAKVPVIAGSSHEIIVNAGVIENGISATRVAYPKFQAYTTNVTTEPGVTTPLSPVVSYNTATVFAQIEDFDDGTISFANTSNGHAPLTLIYSGDPDALEENSGKATMDAINTVFEVASTNLMTLPLSAPVYLEVNYKSDVDLVVGDFISTASAVNQNPMITLRSTNTWKKVYINMSDLGGIWTDGLGYKIYFHAEKGSYTSANVYLDNIKVVY